MSDGPVIHLIPVATEGHLERLDCCGRHPSTLPLGDAVTMRLDRVTCPGPDGYRPVTDDSIEPPPTNPMTDLPDHCASNDPTHERDHDTIRQLTAEVDRLLTALDRAEQATADAHERTITLAEHVAKVGKILQRQTGDLVVGSVVRGAGQNLRILADSADELGALERQATERGLLVDIALQCPEPDETPGAQQVADQATRTILEATRRGLEQMRAEREGEDEVARVRQAAAQRINRMQSQLRDLRRTVLDQADSIAGRHLIPADADLCARTLRTAAGQEASDE